MVDVQNCILIDIDSLRLIRSANLLGAHTVVLHSEVSPFATARYDTSEEAEHADGSDEIAKAELWGVCRSTGVVIDIAIGALAIRPATLSFKLLTRGLILISPTVVGIMRISPLLPSILIEKVIFTIVLLSLLPILVTLLGLCTMKASMFLVVGLRLLCVRLIVSIKSLVAAS